MANPRLPAATAARLAAAALAEDLGLRGDVTSRALIPPGSRSVAEIVAREPGILAGLPLALAVLRRADRRIRIVRRLADGARVRDGTVVLRLAGPTRGILAAERPALNFLQRLSGIATLTRRFVDRVASFGVALLDTRKTAPTLREIEKYAVAVGGGTNHRLGLFDAVLIKDNHLDELRRTLSDAAIAVRLRALRRSGRLRGPVEMEAQSLRDVDLALACGADTIMLDNFGTKRARAAIRRIRSADRRGRRTAIEISGGVGLDNVRSVAALRPDRISVGAVTHSARALDLSLHFLGRGR